MQFLKSAFEESKLELRCNGHKITISLYIPQFQTECVSGCVCPEGLFDDGRGGCVEQKDCPCIHNNELYSSGDKIKVECNTWWVISEYSLLEYILRSHVQAYALKQLQKLEV